MIIFISGTPCCGKTTVASKLSEILSYGLIKINDLAVENDLVLGIDADKEYKIIDVDGLDELLEKTLTDNVIVEGHLSHLCHGADKMIVLRVHPSVLKERLANRRYSPAKIHENLEAEAIGVCSAEAYETYSERVCEIDASNLTADEVCDEILAIVNGDTGGTFGEIDFMDWLIDNS